jgi:hypothetical protein
MKAAARMTRELLRARADTNDTMLPSLDVSWNDQAFTTGTSYTIGQAKAASQTYNAGALFLNNSSKG